MEMEEERMRRMGQNMRPGGQNPGQNNMRPGGQNSRQNNMRPGVQNPGQNRND